MKLYSIVNINSDVYVTTTELAGVGTAIGENHVVYSQAFDGYILVDPIIDLETGLIDGSVLFDPASHAIQSMSRNSFFQLKAEQPDVFFPPVVGPTPEPRYKTLMTSSEFVRDVLTKQEVAAIGALQATDPSVWAWAYITSAGNVSVDHPDFAPGLSLGVTKGVWTEERATEISKGLLIQ